jgi:tetratricopeptide (TPR) repeat protein
VTKVEHEAKLQVVLLECEPGSTRRGWLERWSLSHPSVLPPCLDCALERRGPWAGLDQVFQALAGVLVERAPDLLHEHSYELLSVAPALRDTVDIRFQCLTDVAPEEERVRLFPRDRAMRVPHGLIDLLLSCIGRGLLQPPLRLACDSLDEAGWIATRFFAELARRAGPVVGLRVAAGVRPGAGDAVLAKLLYPALPVEVDRIVLDADPEPAPASEDAGELLATARALEARAASAPASCEALLPRLIKIWADLGDDRRSLDWRGEAFSRYTFRGLYADAWEYGRVVVDRLDEYVGQDEGRRFKVLNKVFGCRGAIRDAHALSELPAFVVAEGLEKLSNPSYRAGAHYILAMLYGRFLPELDLERATTHLELGLAELERSTEAEAQRRFHIAFNRNGLALIRFRQGRADEAIALCRDARQQLDEYLPADEQRLHRSVLVHNIAQVYVSIGENGPAIEHLSEAIAIDPEYSEYYNDRGMVHFRSGNLEAARQDYLRAIALSPPYYEVWTNLGQCLRRAKDHAGAIRAYSRALDLEPGQPLALMGRGDSYQELEKLELACSDYTAALLAVPASWDCLANRAVALYGLGRLEECCADLERAVSLAPDVAELRRNRAIALAELGQAQRAREDLVHYLELEANPTDRAEVLARIAELSAA